VHDGRPPYDLWVVDLRRFGRPHRDTDWVRTRTLEAYAKHYTMAWPFEEHHSGRPCRTSPLYSRLADAGAVFGEKLGWERPNWFADASAGEAAHDVYTYGRQNWFAAVGREHRACREAAVLIDQTSFAKFALKGPDAGAALDWICANNVRKPVGSLTYTQMLDDTGGIQADLTVGRVAHDEYYLVTGTGFATHDFDWIARSIPAGMNAQLFDITSGWSVLTLMGPNARAILQSVTRADMGNEAFPFARMQTIGIAGCPVRALRITYMGELGWELHLPVEYAATVFDTITSAGAAHGLRHGGYRAIESCRLDAEGGGEHIGRHPQHPARAAGKVGRLRRAASAEARERPHEERPLEPVPLIGIEPRGVGPFVLGCLLGAEVGVAIGPGVFWFDAHMASMGSRVGRALGLIDHSEGPISPSSR
jgi:4-methylaminobutanoate oxidase (formaldehyde-forming)